MIKYQMEDMKLVVILNVKLQFKNQFYVIILSAEYILFNGSNNTQIDDAKYHDIVCNANV